MAMMPALRILDWAEAPELVDVATPTPGPGQVRVKVAGCGMCHSDVAMASVTAEIGAALGWQVPFTLGHETAGWVDGVGSGVRGWSDGEAVVVSAARSCGRCRYCREGRENVCRSGTSGRGYGRDGGMAGWVIVDDPLRSLRRLGGLDPSTAGPLADAAATSHHAVARIAPRIRPDGAAVVIGAGGLGVYAIQILRAITDSAIVAVDPDPDRRRIAMDLGAHAAVATTAEAKLDGDLNAAMTDLDIVPEAVDAVIDLVGTDETIAAAADLLAPGGGLALVGAGGGTLRRPWFGGLPHDAEIFTFQGSDLADLDAVIDLARSGAIRSLVDHRPLSEGRAAWDELAHGGLQGRMVLDPTR